MRLNKIDKRQLIDNITTAFDVGKFFNNIPESSERMKHVKVIDDDILDLGDFLYMSLVIACFVGMHTIIATGSLTVAKVLLILALFAIGFKAVIDGLSNRKEGEKTLPIPDVASTLILNKIGIYNYARGINSGLYQRMTRDLRFDYYLGFDKAIADILHANDQDDTALSHLNRFLLDDEQRGNFDSSDYRNVKKAVNQYFEKICQKLEALPTGKMLDQVITNIIQNDRLTLLPDNVKKAYAILIGQQARQDFDN